MRIWKGMTLWVVILTLFVPVTALADIDGGHHDMSTFLSSGSRYTCYACHGIKETAYASNGLGTVGNLCYNRCHSGTGLPSNPGGFVTPNQPEKGDLNGASVAYSATSIQVLGSAHGMTIGLLPSPDQTSSINATGWPHTTANDTNMECTGCHAVHSNTYSPFLNAPLSDTATPANAFCIKCHAGGGTASPAGSANTRYLAISAAPNGSHPVEISDWSAGAAGRTGNGRHGRTISIKGTVYDTVSTNGAALNPPTGHYTVGGKLGNFADHSGGGAVGCYTCHSAHMPSQSGNNNLVIAPVAVNGSNETIDPLCNGCHGPGPTAPSGTSNANPGTTSYYHPANSEVLVSTWDNGTKQGVYTVTPGQFTIPVDLLNKRVSGQGIIWCTSCHEYDVHGGRTTSMAVATTLMTPNPMCAGCHTMAPNTDALGSAANSHHAIGNHNYTTGFGTYTNPTWADAKGYGDLADGLNCHDCHPFNQTAHNW